MTDIVANLIFNRDRLNQSKIASSLAEEFASAAHLPDTRGRDAHQRSPAGVLGSASLIAIYVEVRRFSCGLHDHRARANSLQPEA